ncbi:hypothetical protein [Antrihabitans sp. YC2-6]|uniref:hypothetical protein n=1 Tax=Antrihabitans sp. YC2-6 TaxID=2799498 RepID=UPI0018F5C194|nr:hypothetical protein [Antrihabitans sp. YC2-6]MBJ8343513.1 hypothetical protein [Antrihabitans sp. YC2-6]
MTAELAATATGWRTWRFGCDLCDRTLWTALDHQRTASDMARTNGWIVDDPTLCPACAIVAQHKERADETDRRIG